MNFFLDILNAMINTLWQAALMAFATWLFLRFTRSNAATRHAVWWVALGVILILPLADRVAVLAHRQQERVASIFPQRSVDTVMEPAPATVIFRVTPTPAADWPRVVLSVWSMILLWRLTQIVRSYFYLRGVKRRAELASISLPGIPRRAVVLLSSEIESPMAAGFLPPVVILPRSIMAELQENERDHILLHEAAHISGYDDWTNLSLRLLGGVLALHPVAIWIMGQIERDREIACDDWVVERTGSARVYAHCLAHLVELRQPVPGPILASGFLGGRSRIGRRIEALLDQGRTYSARTSIRETMVSAVGLIFLMFAGSMAPHWIAFAQQGGVPEWQVAAGGKMAFEVASVKPSGSPFHSPSFPLDSGDAYRFTGGRFSATFPLMVYVSFAYKIRLAPDQMKIVLSRLPKWASNERIDIEARAPMGNPTKDQMRLMMQSLLADRFHLALHFEDQTVSALALKPAKPGKLGPRLRPHDEGPPCDATPGGNGNVFPPACDIYTMVHQPNGLFKAGSRNTTIPLLATAIPTFGTVSQPVVDRTGLTGKFDFTLEWLPELTDTARPGTDAQPDGASFLEALREQLGLKLESTKAVIPILIIDHVERPSEN